MEHFYSIDEIVKDCIKEKISQQDIYTVDGIIKQLSSKKIINPVSDLQSLKKTHFKSFGNAPDWYKKTVYYIVESQLQYSNIKQIDILDKLELPNDIFTSDFKMYSPDFRKKHSQYKDVSLEFRESEVDSGRFYRAMIHYIVGYADIYTDRFIDVFGHLGLVPMVSGWGYDKRYCIVDNDDKLNKLKKGINSCSTVFKEIVKIKKRIDEYEPREWDKQFGYSTSVIQYNSADLSDAEYAANFIYSYIMRKEYWVDSNLEEGEQGEINNTKGISSKLSKQYQDLNDIKKDTINSFKESYKRVKFCNNSVLMDNIITDNAFIYVNLPAYIREYERFNFSIELFKKTIEALKLSKGNFIISWKNYVSSKRNNKYKDIHGKKLSLIPPNKMLDKILQLETEERPLYVFEYIDTSGSRQVYSTKFITNINFKEIDIKAFENIYGFYLGSNGELRKSRLPDFIKQNIIGRTI